MGSADWMPRNLDRRVEIIFPVEDEVLKSKVKHILDVQLTDTLKAYEMTEDANYVKVKPQRGKKPVGAQDTFCKEATRLIQRGIRLNPSLPVLSGCMKR